MAPSRLLLAAAIATQAFAQLQPIIDFAGVDFGGLRNVSNSDLFWTPLSTPTVSQGTGPSRDHTLGTDEGVYIYVEASCGTFDGSDSCADRCPEGRRAALDTPTFMAGSVLAFSFWYHMHGEGPAVNPGVTCANVSEFMGQTYVQAINAVGETRLLWFKQGDQVRNTALCRGEGSSSAEFTRGKGDAWRYSGPLYPLNDTVVLRFVHETGIHWASDAALDDITFSFSDRAPSPSLSDAPTDLLDGFIPATSQPSGQPTSFNDDDDDDDDNLNLAILIVVVVIGSLLLIVLLSYCWYCYQTRPVKEDTGDVTTELKVSARDAHSVLLTDGRGNQRGFHRVGNASGVSSPRPGRPRFNAHGSPENDFAGEMKIVTDHPIVDEVKADTEMNAIIRDHTRPSYPGERLDFSRAVQRHPAGRAQRDVRPTRDLLAALEDSRDLQGKLSVLRAFGSVTERGRDKYHFTVEELDDFLQKFPAASHRMTAIEYLFGSGAAVVDEFDVQEIDAVLQRYFLVDAERSRMHQYIRRATIDGRAYQRTA